MGSAVLQEGDSDSVNGSPPEALGGLPLNLNSPSGNAPTKRFFRLCLFLFIDNQGALLCFVKISCKMAEPITCASVEGHIL